MALIANCHRDKKRRARPWTPADFLPSAHKPRRVKVPLTVLRDIFVDRKDPAAVLAKAKADALAQPDPTPTRGLIADPRPRPIPDHRSRRP